jgi:hypothetical protein
MVYKGRYKPLVVINTVHLPDHIITPAKVINNCIQPAPAGAYMGVISHFIPVLLQFVLCFKALMPL